MSDYVPPSTADFYEALEVAHARGYREGVRNERVVSGYLKLRGALEAVLMDASVTYGIISDDGSASPMMVERAAIVKVLGYEDESAWLARTAEINAQQRIDNA